MEELVKKLKQEEGDRLATKITKMPGNERIIYLEGYYAAKTYYDKLKELQSIYSKT